MATVIELKSNGAASASWLITVDQADIGSSRAWAAFADGLVDGNLKTFLTTTFGSFADLVDAMAEFGVVVLLYGNGITGMPEMSVNGIVLPGSDSPVHLRIACAHSLCR